MLKRLPALVCVAVLALIPIYCSAQTEQPTHSAEAARQLKSDPLHVFSESVQQLSSTVTKSVVQVLTTGFGLTTDRAEGRHTPIWKRNAASAPASILSSDGYIVTNAHVIEGARQIRVRLQGLDKSNPDQGEGAATGIEAKLVGVDQLTDLAVLKIDMTDLPALQLANSNDLKQGQVVFAFGSPHGPGELGQHGRGQRDLHGRSIPTSRISTSRPTRLSIPATAAVRWSMSTATWSESTRSSCRSRAATRVWGSRFPATWCAASSTRSAAEGHVHRGQIGVYLRTITPELAEGLHLPVD